jgi:hypothetical protein
MKSSGLLMAGIVAARKWSALSSKTTVQMLPSGTFEWVEIELLSDQSVSFEDIPDTVEYIEHFVQLQRFQGPEGELAMGYAPALDSLFVSLGDQ